MKSKMVPSNIDVDAVLREAFSAESNGDVVSAISAFKIAAKLGSTDAMSKLGTIFDDQVSPPKPKEAVYWYKKGVNSGNSSCAWNLSMHYKDLGNKRWYLYWLKVANIMGDPDAPGEITDADWWIRKHGHHP